MEGQGRGRFFAEHLPVRGDENLMERIQEALDAGDRKEWHLVGVSDIPDEHSPLGARGVGEIGITGAAAAVANAVFNATGRHIRDLPNTLDKLL